MYLLDTNILSELRKAKSQKPHKALLEWVSGLPESSFFISVISVLEIETGILLVERRDTQQGLILRRWLEEHVLPTFENRTLPIDTTIAKRCAPLHVPNPCSDRDALIAATALTHGLIVVTRNVADFEPTGVAIINPWDFK